MATSTSKTRGCPQVCCCSGFNLGVAPLSHALYYLGLQTQQSVAARANRTFSSHPALPSQLSQDCNSKCAGQHRWVLYNNKHKLSGLDPTTVPPEWHGE